MSLEEKGRLIGNIVVSKRTVPRDIQARQIQDFFKANPKYGQAVAEGLGHKLEEVLASEITLSKGVLKSLYLRVGKTQR